MPISTRHSSIFDAAEVFSTVDLRWRVACRTDPPVIPIDDSVFDAALAIHNGNVFIRFELEARMLAGQTDAEIGSKMMLPDEVVARYSHFFFDVRSRLGKPSWLMRNAIGRNPSGVLESTDVGPFWRFIGATYGPLVLEPLLSAVDRDALKQWGIDAYLRDGVQLDAEYRLMILIELMPIPQTLREWKRLRRYEKILSLRGPLLANEIQRPLQMVFVPERSHETTDRLKEAAEASIVNRLNSHTVDETERPIVVQRFAA